MKMKLKYLILGIVFLFFSGLLILHIANDFGDDVVEDYHYHSAAQGDNLTDSGGSHINSDHVPDYVLEEEALPMSETMEELDGEVSFFCF